MTYYDRMLESIEFAKRCIKDDCPISAGMALGEAKAYLAISIENRENTKDYNAVESFNIIHRLYNECLFCRRA